MRSLLQLLPFGKRQVVELGFQELVHRVGSEFTKTLNLAEFVELDAQEIRREVHLAAGRVCDGVCRRFKTTLSQAERERVIEAVLDEAFGLGPLEPLLRDSSIKRIVIDVPDHLVAESDDGRRVVDPAFRDESHCYHVIERMRNLDCCQLNGWPLQRGSKVDILISGSSENSRTLQVTIT